MSQRGASQQISPADAQLGEQLIAAILRGIALTVEVFLHRGFGCFYVGSGVMGFFVLFIFSMWFPPQEISPLLGFGAVYGLVWLIALVNALIRMWRGEYKVHSYYNGRSFLHSVFPNWKEMSVKQVEALLAFLVAIGVHAFTRSLGDYLMLAAFLVFLRAYCFAAHQRNQAIELNDSVIEQQLVADRFRDMQER